MTEALSKTEARALITALFTICYFIAIIVLALRAPEFFNVVFSNLTVLYASAIMNFYGARNGEKRMEQLIQQLPLVAAGKVVEELKPLIELLKTTTEAKQKPL